MNIKDTAFRYLESRPRTVKQMRDRLREKGFEEEEIENTIEELIDFGYLNDEEFVIAYINYGFTKGKGIKMIRYELYSKGVDDNTIEDGMMRYSEEYDYDFNEGEYERAYEIASKIDPFDPKKAARKLQSKGFSSSVVWDTVGKLKKDE